MPPTSLAGNHMYQGTEAERRAMVFPRTGDYFYCIDDDILWCYGFLTGNSHITTPTWVRVEKGYPSYAQTLDFNATALYNVAYNAPANGGCVATPIRVSGILAVYGVQIWNTDAALQRTWNWAIYEQQDQIVNNATYNTIDRVCYGIAAGDTFTPGAASVRLLSRDGASPIFIGPGWFWLVLQNQHAAQTFGFGTVAAAAGFAASMNRNLIKTIAVGLPATLNLVTGWTGGTGMIGALVIGYNRGTVAGI